MAVAQGMCPSCGAPIEFGLGSSLAKVCEFCRATVVRSDRGLENLGKVADLAMTPSLIAVGDEGTLGGRPFQVLGRVQLDHGKGPWDEYYVAFDYGQSWGWLAYAQGHWYVTQQVPGLPAPPYQSLRPEMDVDLGQAGSFRVAEVKSGTIVSGEGELPGGFPPGFTRYYADCYGVNNAFATLDYGDNQGAYTVFTGWVFDEPQMVVTQLGARSANKVKSAQIKCPSCGGDIPKLSGDRAERVGCPYCGAVSDIALQQVVAQQERAMQMPDIPIGSHAVFDGAEYVCIAYMRRSSDFEGERYTWEEYLIWSQPVGFRWLVKDPETGWSWVTPVNLAELDLSTMPSGTSWGGRYFSRRNQNSARADYVLGEIYWKCEIGETTHISDYTNGGDVLSREEGDGEVRWSHSAPMAWPLIAQAFGVPVGGGGGVGVGTGGSSGGGCASSGLVIIIVIAILLICMLGSCGSCLGGGGTSSGGVYRGGSGVYSGGK